MSRRVLVACFETPGYGGAATATYDLFERLQLDGSDVMFLALVDPSQKPFLEATFGPDFANPRHLRDAHVHILNGPFSKPQPALAERIRSMGPDIVLAIGYIAALAIKRATPDTPVILLTAGCNQIDRYLSVHGDAVAVHDWLKAGNVPVLFNRLERNAVDLVDLIIPHSILVDGLIRLFYPGSVGKVYPDVIWMAEWIHGAATVAAASRQPFERRDIDMIFVASRWDRPEKNLPLVRAIVDACPELTIHIVGRLDSPAPGCVCHGFVASRETLFSLLGRSKAVVSPSLWDAAPGILFEASAMECNVIASGNCGNWTICHPELLVDSLTPEAYRDRIHRAVVRRYPDNVSAFIESDSYATLLDVISVL